MSTPTASAAAQPSSTSKKTDHVTTPSRLNLASPAPRSIPSPAATRKDQAGKTPTNHPTASSFGSKTLGGTPMVQSLSQTGHNSSSPATFTPSGLGLGVDLGTGTPGHLNMATPLVGGVGMDLTMSDMGLGSSRGSKRNEDEERRAKMRKVLKSIGRRKGRASRESLDRLARRVGFDTTVDDDEVVMAGKRTLVTIHHKENVLQNVTASVYLDDSELKGYQASIGDVLLRDLKVPDGMLLHSNLDRFALNLDRLARMDRLSADVSCFAAVHGIYKSLDALHKLEVKAIDEQTAGISNSQVQDQAMRKRSGRPGLHGRGRIGLALDYWSTEESQSKADSNRSAMDVDISDKDGEGAMDVPKIFSLRIEVEGSPAPIYPSIRISDAWLPESFDLPHADSIDAIPWNDPPPTYLPEASTNPQDGMAIDETQRLPNLRFVAKLDPPVVMPLQTAVNIFSVVGAQLPPVYNTMQYHALVLDIPPQEAQSGGVQADQTVYGMRDGQEVELPHHYTLDVSKAEFGFRLGEFPFSHPRQLVELLPTLRQWAHAGALLRNAMTSQTASSDKVKTSAQHDELELDDLLNSAPSASSTLDVDVELSTSPEPTMSISFSNLEASQVSNVTFQVLANADIVITYHEGIGEESEMNDGTAKKLARALAICGDLGIWIEWLRQRK